jgi:Arc/MetJ family transcription regulator
MRTNVVLDDDLMARALEAGEGYRTKKSAIEAGLRLLVQMDCQQKLRKLKGKVRWEGNLEEMRRDK